MQFARFHCGLCALAVAVVATAGCVDGPFGGLARLNPVLRQKWEQDEKFGPTFHRRLADLQGVRSSAAWLAPQKKEEIANDMSRLFSAESNPVLRAEMVGILGDLGIPSALETLRVAVADADEDVRIAACHAWGKIGGAEAIPVLKDLMDRETDVDVRLAAIGELGHFPEQAALEILGQALDDNDPAVQFLAVQSLKTSTGRDFGDSVPAWREFVQGREPPAASTPSFVERMTHWF